MNDKTNLHYVKACRAIQRDADNIRQPERIVPLKSLGLVLDPTILSGGHWYLERIGAQINTCYENSCFDGCLVLMRRLLETLIIEVYEHNQRDHEIKDKNGDFFMLNDLVSNVLAANWNLGRNTKRSLPKFKSLGDSSAHNRRFIARRSDVEPHIPNYRMVIEELYHLSIR